MTTTEHPITVVPFSERTKSEMREVRRRMGHGVCGTCRRVVVINKMGKFEHIGDPVE